MADTDKSLPDEIDHRHRIAQRYLKAAHQELAAKEEAKPHSQRTRRSGEPTAASLIPSISLSTLVHTLLLMLAITFAALALAWCYVLLDTMFIAGRIVAMPTGVVLFAAISYASAYYLGIIESTSNGHTYPDDSLDGGWQEWFWTLPSTLGIAAMAAGTGYLISFDAPQEMLKIMAFTAWLVHPIFQLSTLENSSPFAPLSLPILSTLLTRPIAWILFYTNSFVLFAVFTAVIKFTWQDPPYLSILAVGPASTIVLLIYAWLLGQLARWLTVKGT